MKAIIGLGNPGKNYEKTRHNVGFMVIDALSERLNIPVTSQKFRGLVGEGLLNGEKVILLKPLTYMNLSGESVRELVDWYKLPIENICIIYDDLDLPTGSIRLRIKGSAGGHNGVKSIIQHIGSDHIKRVRIGINRPPAGWNVPDYVLSNFKETEWQEIKQSITKAVDAMAEWVNEPFEIVMNKYNV
jgi:PTH1 family peptidyl-tRNA hydrolase